MKEGTWSRFLTSMGAQIVSASRGADPEGLTYFYDTGSTATDTRGVFGVFLEGRHDGVFAAEARGCDALKCVQHTFVIFRHHFYKFAHERIPILEHVGGL